jgi:putative flippase GtrA
MSSSTRLARFAGVGFVGFAIQCAVLHMLAAGAGVHYAIATGLAVEAAILHNFAWHEAWTWRDRMAGTGGRLARLMRFNGFTAVVSILGNVMLVTLFVESLRLPLIVSNAMAVVSVSIVNLVASDLWVFRARRRPPAHREASSTRLRRAADGARLNLAVLVPIVVAGLVVASSEQASAAQLEIETLTAWDRYVALTERRIERELADTRGLLAADFDTRKTTAVSSEGLRSGHIPVSSIATLGDDGAGIEIPSGMIHHWRGGVFVPGATVDELVSAVRDPTGRRAHRQQDVLETRVLERSTDGLRLYLKLQRKSIVSVAYNTEHDVHYLWQGTGRASSRSVATKIAEIQDLGSPQERECPQGHDRGFMWRLNSYWRYEAVPGGVIVELESLTLSRDLPWGIRTIARPVINTVARESIERTLSAMRSRFAGVQSAAR